MAIGSWLSAADGDASGFWFQSLLAQDRLPRVLRLGRGRCREQVGHRGRQAPLRVRPAAQRLDPGQLRHRLHLCRRRTGERVARRRRTRTSTPVSATRPWRRCSSAARSTSRRRRNRDAGAATAPPERSPGRALRARPLDVLLDLPAEGEHAAPERLPRQRQGRHVALHAGKGRLHARRDARRPRQGLRGHDSSAFRLSLSLSLLLLWRRSRRRGRIGRTASVLLRSLYTLVLGLGGWFAGVVVVQLAFPAVPLDDVLLAVLSIGVPIGLGIYLAWVNRDLSGTDRTVGFVAAMAGALAGAWLGFHAATGLLAVITTIVGAAVGANLVRHRSGHLMGSAGSRPFCRNNRQRDAGGAPFDGLRPTRSWPGSAGGGCRSPPPPAAACPPAEDGRRWRP